MGSEYGHLGRLPSEIVLQILAWLDAVTLSSCLQVCKMLSRCILESTALRYELELAWYGYVDGLPTPSGPYATKAGRLQAFRRYMNAWSNLFWEETRVPIPPSTSYEIDGGVYASSDGHSLWCMELPSSLRGTKLKKWSYSNIGFVVADFTFNPKQDLLIAIELQQVEGEDYDDWVYDASAANWKPVVHILSLKTGAAHPRASNPHLLPDIYANVGLMQMRIMGNLYGLLCPVATDDRTGFVAYEWDTGKKIVCTTLESDATSFAFIDERHIIMPSDLKVDPNIDANLTLYRMGDSGLVPIALFEFPVLAYPHQTTILDIVSDPPPSVAAGHYSRRNPAPFEINNQRTIWVHWAICETRDDFDEDDGTAVGNVAERLEEFNLVIHTDELVRLVLSSAADQNVSVSPASLSGTISGVRRFDWKMWGPQVALMMQRKNVPSNNFECFMYGNRHVALENHSEIVLTDWSRVRYPLPSWLEHPNADISNTREALIRNLAEEPFHTERSCLACLFSGSFRSASMTCQTRRRQLSTPLSPGGTTPNGVMMDAENIVLFEETDESETVEMIILTIGCGDKRIVQPAGNGTLGRDQCLDVSDVQGG